MPHPELPRGIEPATSPTSSRSVPQLDLARDFRPTPGLGLGSSVALLVKYQQKPADLLEHRSTFQAAQKHSRFGPLLLPLRQEKWGGGFAAVLPLNPTMDPTRCRWRMDCDEVRGLVPLGNGLTLLAQANRLSLLDATNGRLERHLDHPRFRNLHSVAVAPDRPGVVLVSNTGQDSILEVDIQTGAILWEWQAWSHGYDRNPFGIRLHAGHQPPPPPPGGAWQLLSQPEAMDKMANEEPPPANSTYLLLVDPESVTHPLGLAKWQKGAEPNWAGYRPNSDQILATFFVANQAVVIDRTSGAVQVVAAGLSRPHAMMPYQDRYVISDTRKGKVLILDATFRLEQILDFSNLPWPTDAPPAGEWLQYTSPIGDGSLLATVDGGRYQLVVWNPDDGTYCCYPYNRAWSVHAVLDYS